MQLSGMQWRAWIQLFFLLSMLLRTETAIYSSVRDFQIVFWLNVQETFERFVCYAFELPCKPAR